MSMGPSQKQEEPGISRLGQIRYQLKKTTEEYFRDPIHYLCYAFLAFTLIGLGFGAKFSWQYYAILAILFGIEMYQKFIGNKPKQ